MTGICSTCGREQALHMMTYRKTLREDGHTGVGRAHLYCSHCQQHWLEHEGMVAMERERPLASGAPRRGRAPALGGRGGVR